MEKKRNKAVLSVDFPEIPSKLYFSISEASNLVMVKPYVLRYWEKEFAKIIPNKRRGGRRYYERQDILLIRHIRSLLYEQGFTIEGARQQLQKTRRRGGERGALSLDTMEFVRSIINELKRILAYLEN